MAKHIIIIGNSAAGIAAVESIRKRDKEAKITVVSDENYPAYCRCLISYYLAGKVKEEKLIYRKEDFYRENNIELMLNKKVLRVDPKKNRLTLEDKSQLNYDYLLIATGSSPKFPDIKGIKKEGVFGLRTIKDAKNIETLLPITKAVCVLGAGLIGLKAADALRKRNVEVKVVIKSKQVLSQMLDLQAAEFVQKKLQENGIEIILGQDVTEIIGEGDIRAVKLDSGKVFGCSLVVVGKGVSANIDLIKDTEVKFSEGISANEFLQTNIPNIYTAGDACESFDLTLGRPALNALWPVAVEQGKIAGANIAGGNIRYEGSVGMNSLDFANLPVLSLGLHRIKEEEKLSFEELKVLDEKANRYKRLILKGSILAGAILVGDIRNGGIFLRLIRDKIDVSPFKDRLLSDNFGYPDIVDFIREEDHIYI